MDRPNDIQRAHIAALLTALDDLDARGIAASYVSAAGGAPYVMLPLATFLDRFDGQEVTVEHSPYSDSYEIEVDGVGYRAIDYAASHQRKPAREVVRVGAAVAK